MKNGNMWTFFMRKIFWEVKFLKIKKNDTPGDRVILPQVFHLNSENLGGGVHSQNGFNSWGLFFINARVNPRKYGG